MVYALSCTIFKILLSLSVLWHPYHVIELFPLLVYDNVRRQ